jgi:hypothetical protein
VIRNLFSWESPCADEPAYEHERVLLSPRAIQRTTERAGPRLIHLSLAGTPALPPGRDLFAPAPAGPSTSCGTPPSPTPPGTGLICHPAGPLPPRPGVLPERYTRLDRGAVATVTAEADPARRRDSAPDRSSSRKVTVSAWHRRRATRPIPGGRLPDPLSLMAVHVSASYARRKQRITPRTSAAQ